MAQQDKEETKKIEGGGVGPLPREKGKQTMEMHELIINKLGYIPTNPDREDVWLTNYDRVQIQEFDKNNVKLTGVETRTEIVIPKDSSMEMWKRAANFAWFADATDTPMWDIEKLLVERFPSRDANHSKGGEDQKTMSLFFSMDLVWLRITFVDELNLYRIQEWGEGDGEYYATSPENVIERILYVENLWTKIMREDAEAKFWKSQSQEA